MRYAHDLAVALPIVRDASRAALSQQRGIATAKSAHLKPDSTTLGGVSPVTAADFMVQTLILGSLAAAFPADRFIAEESSAELLAAGSATCEAVVRAVNAHSAKTVSEAEVLRTLDLGMTGAADGWSGTRRTWVLDPIDGTKGFLRGDQFAVALALLDEGRPVVSCLGCPNLGDAGRLFYAMRGAGAYESNVFGDGRSDSLGPATDLDPIGDPIASGARRVRVQPEPVGGGLVRCEAFEGKHTDHAHAAAVAEQLGCSGTPPIRMDGQGKYGVVARGEAHVYMRLPPAGYRERIWDHAAGSLLVTEAGGRVSDLSGRPLDFSRGDQLSADVSGIVASNGVVHDALLRALGSAEVDGSPTSVAGGA